MSVQAAILTNASLNTSLTSTRVALLANNGLLLAMAITSNHHQCSELIKITHRREVSPTLLKKCIIVAISSLNYGAMISLLSYQSSADQEKCLDDYLKTSIMYDNAPALQELTKLFRLKIIARAGSLISSAVKNRSTFCIEELFTLHCHIDYKSVFNTLNDLLMRDTPTAIRLINIINVSDMTSVAIRCIEADNPKAFRVAIGRCIPPPDVSRLFLLTASKGADSFAEIILAVYPELRDLSSIFLQVMLASEEYMSESLVMSVVKYPYFDKSLAPSYLAAALEQEMVMVVGHLLADP